MALPTATNIRDARPQGCSDLNLEFRSTAVGFHSLVTKDDGLRWRLSLFTGAPPKVLWLVRPNQSTQPFQDSVTRRDVNRVVSSRNPNTSTAARCAEGCAAEHLSAPSTTATASLRINRHRPSPRAAHGIRQCAVTVNAAWRRRISSDGRNEAHPGVGAFKSLAKALGSLLSTSCRRFEARAWSFLI